jgi:hypothetical protein
MSSNGLSRLIQKQRGEKCQPINRKQTRCTLKSQTFVTLDVISAPAMIQRGKGNTWIFPYSRRALLPKMYWQYQWNKSAIQRPGKHIRVQAARFSAGKSKRSCFDSSVEKGKSSYDSTTFTKTQPC